MREVLKDIEEMGVFDHLTEKKEIKRIERGTRRVGKKHSFGEDDRDLGGKPSVYKITTEFEKLTNLMEKPGVIELLYEKMTRSGLAYSLMKYQQLAFWHAAKMDETILPKLISSGNTFFPNELKEQDIPDFKTVYQRLQLLDENQLDALADEGAKALLENPNYQSFFISICGLPQL